MTRPVTTYSFRRKNQKRNKRRRVAKNRVKYKFNEETLPWVETGGEKRHHVM